MCSRHIQTRQAEITHTRGVLMRLHSTPRSKHKKPCCGPWCTPASAYTWHPSSCSLCVLPDDEWPGAEPGMAQHTLKLQPEAADRASLWVTQGVTADGVPCTASCDTNRGCILCSWSWSCTAAPGALTHGRLLGASGFGPASAGNKCAENGAVRAADGVPYSVACLWVLSFPGTV